MLVQTPDLIPTDPEAEDASPTGSPFVLLPAKPESWVGRMRRHLRRCLIAVGLVYLYFPNLILLRILGPRAGLTWSKWVAWLHWSLTFVGAQRDLKRALTRVRPHLDTKLSVNTLLRKHLELKHRSFAQWRLSVTPRGQKMLAEMYSGFEGADVMLRLAEERKGILVVAYHFGLYKLLSHGLSVSYDVPVYQLSYRSAHYARHTLGLVARWALANAIATDRRSKVRNIYVTPTISPTSGRNILKRLRRGNVVGIAGDGAVSSEFVDVSFLGGTIALPDGWARLAAYSKAPVVVMFDTVEADGNHKISISQPMYCQDDSPQSVQAIVQQAANILEATVRRQPWAWHLWHRIEFLSKPDEPLRMRINPSTVERTMFHYEPTDNDRKNDDAERKPSGR